MKNIIRNVSLALMLLSLPAVYGQEKQDDPRRTAAEQAIFEKSVPGNPAKITPASKVDPRLDPAQNQAGATNWKPVKATPEDRKEVVPAQPGKNPAENQPSTDPAGLQSPAPVSTKPLNYREINGSKTQPKAPEGTITNYRDLNGPKSQPEGVKPKR
jgi:hypothetical protein